MVLGKKISSGIIFKGDFKRSPRKKKYSTLELQGIAGEILLNKTVKRSNLFGCRVKQVLVTIRDKFKAWMEKDAENLQILEPLP